MDAPSDATLVRAAIGYAPQALSADGELIGYENLLVFASLYDIPHAKRAQRIAEALAFMDLLDTAGRLVATYSGGMIRRLEIAQSMLHGPHLLFSDEPTVGLDPVARDMVCAHIRELRAKCDTTIFMTTHYREEAQALCSRFDILRAGWLVACGSLTKLRAASARVDATLDELFAHYTAESAEAAGAMAISPTRGRTASNWPEVLRRSPNRYSNSTASTAPGGLWRGHQLRHETFESFP